METEELIEHILRQKHLEEMMNRPEKEHTPLEGMDNEQIKRFALFLFEETCLRRIRTRASSLMK